MQIVTSNLLIVIVLSTYVYARSFPIPAPGQANPEYRELTPGGHTGTVLFDFFIGRELNSRVALPIPFVSKASKTIDIGLFCEVRPGLMGWLILNLANIARQYRAHGYVTDPILRISAI